MLLLKLAYRNLMGQGLRTWLNVGILSFIYVLIIWHQGIFSGMLKYGSQNMIQDEIAGGQYWNINYDPYDPLSLDDGHAKIPAELQGFVDQNKAVPILIRSASIYPEGRIQSVFLRAIIPQQTILGIPTSALDTDDVEFPIMIGTRFAKKNSFNKGDYITIRFRDVKGTFDAIEGEIVEIMHTDVPTIDNGQLWVSLDKLQSLTELKNEATMIVIDQEVENPVTGITDWEFKDNDFLLKDLTAMVASKRIGGGILYAVLLFLVMLAVFDTQVLAIFRRRKEIGTLMALGMTRIRVIMLFTLEGALNGILAIGAASIYGIPWIIYFKNVGMKLPEITEDYGFPIVQRLFPVYSAGLVIITIVIVMVTITIVSFLPTRKISKLKPTDALRGKM